MKQRLRNSWREGRLLSAEQSSTFAALSPKARDLFIARIVSGLRSKEDANQRRIAHYRAPRA
jgi:hypothetical protein